MSAPSFTGTLTALITPFRDSHVVFDDLEALVNRQIEAGIDGLVPCGTTGESPTLNHEEHIDVIRAVVSAAQGRVPVIAGCGSNSTREAVCLTRLAHEADVDGVLQVAPYYNKPSAEGLFRHFSAVAEQTDKPIVLYSIPSRCGIEIPVSTVARLRSAHPNVNHIKEAGGSCDRMDQLTQSLGDSITILSGDDALTLPFMAMGAKGVISVASNLYPGEIRNMVQAFARSDIETALKLHQRFYPLFKALFCEPNPVPIKCAMHHLGLIGALDVRRPLCEMTPENRSELLSVIETTGRPA
ncbi:MAG: 4-hydroxy-tetrahydrodipicolinate synthase [Verrucomicrobia bacterium]|nr:MAG: 4-hydroxy-tetrahydrodipicolinate synthase [Verrucomicrobiota bacterium]